MKIGCASALALSCLVALASLVACAGSSNESVTTAPDAQRGEALVAERGCPSCHAASLAGADVPRPGTHAYPANLTSDPETGLGTWTDAEVIRAIRSGVDDEGEELCREMPRFDDLSDADAAAIVSYLRTLPAVRHDVPASRCSGAT